MAQTSRLLLPSIAAGQAQKHVTHNDALRMLDGIVQASVINTTLTAPPGSPAVGDTYIVASGGSGVWSGWDGDVAIYADGAWYRLVAGEGWRIWDQATESMIVRVGSSWVALGVAMGFVEKSGLVDVAVSANGGATGLGVLEEDLTGLSGASVDSTIEIPADAICLGVSTRNIAAVTGATSYDCGIVGETSKFGGSLGVALGSTNKGIINPEAFSSATTIRLSSNGSDFTGGDVRIAIHYLAVEIPSA